MTIVFISREDGLGSRIINLVNGIYFAEKNNLKYKINWKPRPKSNIKLKNIFTNINYSEINVEQIIKNKNIYKINSAKDEKFNINSLKNNDILYNSHHARINKNEFIKIFMNFKMNNYISNMVKIFKVFSLENIVGVHVRRGDLINNKNEILKYDCKSRLINNEKYFEYLDKKNIKQIFLCTENNETYNQFSKKYNIIRYYHSSLKRYKTIGLQDAFIDMILLSKCKEIVSGKSNFSLCASYIGNKKLRILLND